MLMKKHLLLMLTALSAFSVEVQADKGFTTLDESAMGVAVSPNGRYVVGYNPDGSTWNGNIFMTSFVYDISEAKMQ